MGSQKRNDGRDVYDLPPYDVQSAERARAIDKEVQKDFDDRVYASLTAGTPSGGSTGQGLCPDIAADLIGSDWHLTLNRRPNSTVYIVNQADIVGLARALRLVMDFPESQS